MKNTVIFFLCGIFCLAACKKTETADPNISANGEYFYCNIDGKHWSYKQCSYCNSDALLAGPQQVDFKHYSIKAKSSDFPQTEIGFAIDNADLLRSDTVRFVSLNSSFGTVWNPYSSDTANSSEYQTINGSQGQLIFTSKTSTTIEGIFEMDVTNPQNKIVHITQGKFLIKL